MKETILAIVMQAYLTAEVASKRKYSGMHEVEDYLGKKGRTVFRIHQTHLLPQFISDQVTNEMIDTIVRPIIGIEYDPVSMWLTIG
jgi:hypothetical protein